MVKFDDLNDDLIEYLREFIDLNAPDHQGTTALHVAASDYRRTSATDLLIRLGARVDVKDKDGNTPLHLAVSFTRIRNVSVLLENRANPNIVNSSGTAPLHLAAMLEYRGFSRRLLRAGANPNIADSEGNTPLHYAILNDRTEVFELLLKNGADWNTPNRAGVRPVELIQAGTEFVQYLDNARKGMYTSVRTGGEENAPEKMLNCNWFDWEFWRVGSYSEENVTACINDGSAVQSKDEIGWTVLHWAMVHRPWDGGLVKLLYNNGANLDEAAYDGERPLHLSVMHWRTGGTKMLINLGADVNVADNVGWTPLHSAVSRARASNARLLLKAKANPEAEGGPEGQRPAQFASLLSVDSHREEILEMLKSAGAETDYTPKCETSEKFKNSAKNIGGSTIVGCLIGVVLAFLDGGVTLIAGCLTTGGIAAITSGESELRSWKQDHCETHIEAGVRIEF